MFLITLHGHAPQPFLQVDVNRSMDASALPSARTPQPSYGGLPPSINSSASTLTASQNHGLGISTAGLGAYHAGPLSATGPGPSTRREIGDLYVWGSLATMDDEDAYMVGLGPHRQPPVAPCTHMDPMCSWQQTARPTLVYNTGSVNVMRVACGTRHAALLSRAGELYTWGYGKGGALGHGALMSMASPRRVEGAWVKAHDRVQSLAASEGCTAAITSEGCLYTWGQGRAGQLGHGSSFGCAYPKLVASLFDAHVRVMQVRGVGGQLQ